jgi:hypothetical protein
MSANSNRMTIIKKKKKLKKEIERGWSEVRVVILMLSLIGHYSDELNSRG